MQEIIPRNAFLIPFVLITTRHVQVVFFLMKYPASTLTKTWIEVICADTLMRKLKRNWKAIGRTNMAEMHPGDITKKKHVPSEEKMFNALRDQLGPKYHVFFSVRWYSEDSEGKREDSECDFLIFNPDYGFLCIEVKGGRGIYVDENDEWYLIEEDGDRKLKKSPYFQAEQSMRFFKKYYEEELETHFPGIYGAAVAFPNFKVSSQITVESPQELTIDLDDMGALQKRIVEIFRYYNVKSTGRASFMSPDAQKKFINLINKRVALSIAAGALIEDKERELEEINQTQDVIIDLLTNYPKAFIIGGAGTGKTWIGIKKIKRCLKTGGNAIYMCVNKILSDEVRKIVSDPRAIVLCVDELAKDILGDKVKNAKCVNGCKEYGVLFGAEEKLPQYDIVIIDEAQDFTEDWAYCSNLLMKDGGSLYVFYDENQNVYARNFGDKFFIDSEPFVLRYNIRNTSNIYQYTKDRTSLGTDTLVNQIEGVEPDVRRLQKKQQVINFLDSVVNKLVNKEGVAVNKIVILSNREYEESALKGINQVGGYTLSTDIEAENDYIRFSTVENFKGLESDIVIYINQTYKDEAMSHDLRSIQYTALTRARFYLYVVDYESN